MDDILYRIKNYNTGVDYIQEKKNFKKRFSYVVIVLYIKIIKRGIIQCNRS